MDFALTAEQKKLREQVVEFACGVLSQGAAARDRAQTFPRELWRQCGEYGLLGLPVDEEYGGLGLDPLSCAIALEALGYGCKDGGLVFSVCAHMLSCVVPIWKYGTADQKNRYLKGLCDGTLVGGNATTEPDSGSDAFAMQSHAEPCDGGFVLEGTKLFVTNGPVADLIIVYAATDRSRGYHGGITGFLVERNTPGFQQEGKIEKMGLRTSPLGEIVLDHVFVPHDAVLGGVGGGSAIFLESMDWERTLLFAAHVGTIDRLLEQSIEYARTRNQFGHPIGKYQGVSHHIAELKARAEAGRLLTYRAAARLGKSRTVSLDASMAKLFVSETLVQVATNAMQVHGGYGYTTEYEIERAVRDAMACTLYSGTSEMQRNTIARWLRL